MEVAGSIGVVWEMCDKGTVERALSQGDVHLTWQGKKMEFAQSVAKAMAFVHKQRILHLDIKAASILLSNGWVAKVAGPANPARTSSLC